jgi:hypothetical protein
MVLTLLALVAMFLGLIGIYVLNAFAIKSIIRDIAYRVKYFVKNYDLTNEAIKNITWKEHDRLFWVITSTWLLSMIFSALIVVVLFELFG